MRLFVFMFIWLCERQVFSLHEMSKSRLPCIDLMCRHSTTTRLLRMKQNIFVECDDFDNDFECDFFVDCANERQIPSSISIRERLYERGCMRDVPPHGANMADQNPYCRYNNIFITHTHTLIHARTHNPNKRQNNLLNFSFRNTTAPRTKTICHIAVHTKHLTRHTPKMYSARYGTHFHTAYKQWKEPPLDAIATIVQMLLFFYDFSFRFEQNATPNGKW